MSLDWQQIVTLVIVGVSAALLVKQQVRSRRHAKMRACGSDCGCSSSSKLKDIKEQILNPKAK
jgi:hypothetical protein